MGHFLRSLASKVKGAVHLQSSDHEAHTDGLLSEVLSSSPRAGGQGHRPPPLSQEEMAEFLEDGPAPSRKPPLTQEEMAEFLEDGPAPAKKPPLSQEEMAEYLE